ncbi:MAG: CpsD/CapB family tyrosine-protein kinase [Amaricoccus sp.]|uniref:CpsD/CapB family tyrosine-protein kinase n=1 Tax=Amaricoccus sp. TaxID=1872485 RepID=UPI0039E67999
MTSGGLVPALGKDEVANLRETLRKRRGGMFAEAVRGLLHALERSNGDVMPASVLVTSALPGEGKSTLALALALEIAAGGRKVLLVDADLRQGRLAEVFGAAEAPGLLDLLAGEASVESVIRHDPESRVDYITRGNAEGFGALREARQLADLMRLAEARGAVVIFDSAPVLATTETAILAGIAERSLLVLRWGRTHRRAADLSVAQIGAQTSGPIVATVNAVDLKRHAQYGFHDAGMFVDRLAKYYPERR